MDDGLLLGLVACALLASGCATATKDSDIEEGSGLASASTGEGGVGGAGAGGDPGVDATTAATTAGVGGSGGGDTVCTGGLALCDGECVDLQTDPEHCGGCPYQCGTHPCHLGVCQTYEVIATGQASARGIAVDATNVYWTSEGNGTVMTMPSAGGFATPLAPGQNLPRAIAVDATNVYWANAGDGKVRQIPKAGGTPIDLASDGGFGVAVDATSVYWTSSADKIMKAPIGGGTPMIVANAPDAATLAVRAGWVYFTTSGIGDITVERVPVTGGVPQLLGTSSGPAFVPAIAVDALAVYWADGDQLLAVPLAGSLPPATVGAAFGLWQVAADGTSVFWGTNGGMNVLKAPQGSISSVTVATTYAEPVTELAVDATHVYWTSYGSGAILKAPK